MTTPSSSSLSHALHPPQRLQPEQQLPRLQLAPPEHQKHMQSQALARQQQESSQQLQPNNVNASAHRERERASPVSSSREVSPAVGLDESTSAGDKRKSNAPNNPTSKKRRTEQEEPYNPPPQPYGLGTHYPYAFYGQGTPGFHPSSSPAAQQDSGFNEFQWRILNLCAEFYEAATELIRSTPHLVLSQAFQLLSRGTGTDPISVLNDARRTCDILLANPHSLATPPPMPTVIPLPVLNSLAQLNARATAAAPGSVPASYYTPPVPPPAAVAPEKPTKSKEKERLPSNVQGTWKEHEIDRLKALAEKYRIRDRPIPEEEEEEEEAEDGEGVPDDEANSPRNPSVDPNTPGDPNANASGSPTSMKKPKDLGEIDWDKVVAEFGDERSRHQVLIKATALRLKASSSIPGKKPKKKKPAMAIIEPPAPTFSSSSVKTMPVNYTSPSLPTTPATSTFKTSTSSSSTLLPKPAIAPVPPGMPYPQPGWYPHPQTPYYPYAQPMYYPQGYGVQNYGIPGGPQPGYYSQYAPPLLEALEKPQTKSRGRKSNGTLSASITNANTNPTASPSTPVPPPTLPPKAPGPLPTATPSTDSTAKQAVTFATGSSEGKSASASSTPGGSALSGLPRRLPSGSNDLFTYTPLPHGSTAGSAEPGK